MGVQWKKCGPAREEMKGELQEDRRRRMRQSNEAGRQLGNVASLSPGHKKAQHRNNGDAQDNRTRHLARDQDDREQYAYQGKARPAPDEKSPAPTKVAGLERLMTTAIFQSDECDEESEVPQVTAILRECGIAAMIFSRNSRKWKASGR